MPNRLPLPPDLMSMIEKRDDADRRKAKRREAAPKVKTLNAQEASENDRRAKRDRRGKPNRRGTTASEKAKR